MADFLEEKRREIRARMQELKPQVEEYHRLEAAIQALEGVKTSIPLHRAILDNPAFIAGNFSTRFMETFER